MQGPVRNMMRLANSWQGPTPNVVATLVEYVRKQRLQFVASARVDRALRPLV